MIMNVNQKLIISLSFGCVILSTFVDNNDKSNFNFSYNSVQSVVTLNGGAQNRSVENTSTVSQVLEQTINRREMLRKHFPDWEERMDYQKKQEKKFFLVFFVYQSGLAQIAEAKRLRVKFKLTKQEQDAFDYSREKQKYARKFFEKL